MMAGTVSVRIPTGTVPQRVQEIIGKQSAPSPDLEEFRSIPFGIVPGRWKRSELRTELPSDVFDASRNGPKCPQPAEPNTSATFGRLIPFPDAGESETGCLNLFTIRPSEVALARIGSKLSNLPVFVWIHGGGYAFGAGTDPMWDPGRLVLRSVELGTPFIAVNLNYRLNYFGLGASSDVIHDQPFGCNFGLYDQKLGLQWVSQNIRAFRGDPSKITIGGQFAGAASANVHALDAKFGAGAPLFRRVVMQSGSVGCLGPPPLREAEEQWSTLCSHFGLEECAPETKLQKLRALSVQDLLQAGEALGWSTFPVVLDELSLKTTSLGSGALVTLGEEETAECVSLQNQIEIMLSDTDAEASIFLQGVSENPSLNEVHSIFESGYSTACQEVLEAYSLTSSQSSSAIRNRLTNYLGDMMFGHPLSQAQRFFSSFQGDSNFTAHPTTTKSLKVKFGNPFPLEPCPNSGVSHHCVELIYMFDAFHDDLEDADEGLMEVSTEMSPGTSGASSAFASPATPSPLSAAALKEPRVYTNRALREKMQGDWIRYTKENYTPPTDEMTIYNQDRSWTVEKMSRNSEITQQEERFRVLAKYPTGSKKVMRALMSSLAR